MPNGKSSSSMFVRNATGLVRELTPFDAFNMVFAAILIPVGISQALNFGAASFPGANIALAFIIGAIVLMSFGAVYVLFTIAMPRSGGDYVWVSRSLSPFIGFVVNVTLTFVFVNWVAFNFTTMMTLFVPAAGYVMGWPDNVINWFNTSEHQFFVATILTAIFAVIMILGTKFVSKFMRILFILVWTGMLVWFIGLILTPNSIFVDNFINSTGVQPSTISQLAKASGFSVSNSLNIGMTLLAMLWAFQNLTGFEFTGYFAGELKSVRKTVVISVMGGLFAGAILYAIGSFLVYRTVGFDLFSNLSYLGVNAPDKLPKGAVYILPALTKFLALPFGLKSFIVFSFMISILWWTPVGYMLGTRNLFAWSFDHLAPAGISDVHPTLHTPVKATIVMAIYIELLNFLNIYAGLGNFLINIIAVMAFAFVIVGLAAVVFPYKRKDLFENAPEIVHKRIFGMPLMTIAGIITMISWLFVLIAAFSASQFGMKITLVAMIEAFSVPIIAAIWYIVAISVRKHQGIDMKKVFSEIPPE